MEVFFIFVQTLGFVAFGISLLSYQFKNQKQMFAMRCVSDTIWVIHYFFLGAITPALTILIAVFRTGSVVFIFKNHRIKLLIFSMLFVVMICVYYGKGEWQNYLPILTAAVYGLSTYFHENYIVSRVLMAIGLCIWVWIGILFQSYPEIVSSSFGLMSLIIAFYKHEIRPKRNQALQTEPIEPKSQS
jgi:hypothetical protein